MATSPQGSQALVSLVCQGTLPESLPKSLDGTTVRFDFLDPTSKPEDPRYTSSEPVALRGLEGREVVHLENYDLQSLSANFLKPGIANPTFGTRRATRLTRSVALFSAVFINTKGKESYKVNYPLQNLFFASLNSQSQPFVKQFEQAELEAPYRASRVVALTLNLDQERDFGDLTQLTTAPDGEVLTSYGSISRPELGLRHFHYQDESPEAPKVFPLRSAYDYEPGGARQKRDIEWVGPLDRYVENPFTGEREGPYVDTDKAKREGNFVRTFPKEQTLESGEGAKPCIPYKFPQVDAIPLYVTVEAPKDLSGILTARVELPSAENDISRPTDVTLELEAGKTYLLASANWLGAHNTRGREPLDVTFQLRSSQPGTYGMPIGPRAKKWLDVAGLEALQAAEGRFLGYAKPLDSLRLRVTVGLKGVETVTADGASAESTCEAVTRLFYGKPAPFYHYGKSRLDPSIMREANWDKRVKKEVKAKAD